MKNLYKLLKVERGSSIGKIKAAIERCQNNGTKQDAKRVLLEPESRQVYDRNHELLTTIGELRSNLGLTYSPNWDGELRKEFTKSKAPIWWTVLAMFALVIGVLGFLNSSYWKFEQTKKRDTVAAYEEFLVGHHRSKYYDEAKARFDFLRCEKEWSRLEPLIDRYSKTLTYAISSQASLVNDLNDFVDEFEDLERAEVAEEILENMQIDFLRDVDSPRDAKYILKIFPDSAIGNLVLERAVGWGGDTRDPEKLALIMGLLESDVMEGVSQSKLIEVRSQLRTRIQESLFEAAVADGTEGSLKKFIAEYPDSVFRERAELKLAALHERYRNWRFVSDQNSKAAYERYLQLEPNGQHSEDARRRLIDLEVDDILKGDVGELPDLQPLKFSNQSRMAEVEVKNDTAYTLTVRYSGPDSQKHVIPPRGTRNFSIAKGKYRVAASVEASRVRPYAGSEDISYDQYGSSFFIRTTGF